MTRVHRVASISLTVGLTLAGCKDDASPEPGSIPQSPTVTTADAGHQPQPTEPFSPTVPIEPDNFTPEQNFTSLRIDDFTPIAGEDDTWQEIEGVIVCSGRPKGYFRSRKSYVNFTWRAEFRFASVTDEARQPLANTGFMVHIQPPDKVWPRSLEVQGRWDAMASVKANGGAAELVVSDDEAARQSARKALGEWNAVEIVSRNGTLTATLNGELICISEPGELTEGSIGLQSELFAVHFRRLRIRVDD